MHNLLATHSRYRPNVMRHAASVYTQPPGGPPAVFLRGLALLAAVCLASVPARANPASDDTPALLCRGAIAAAETQYHIPDAFLSAIGRVETGRAMPRFGGLAPWPWTINAGGQGHFYATKQEAMDAVRRFRAQGVSSIDAGCVQVSLLYHPEAFATLDQAFDPVANANFAARLLRDLYIQTGSWPRAAAAYHSATPARGDPYAQKVLAEWGVPDRRMPYAARGASSATDSVPPPGSATAGAPTATPQAAGPPMLAASAGAPAPAVGFNRTNPPGRPLGAGRTLAGYRAFPVRLALQPPPKVFGPR